mmetsp:Transcript_25491/g.59726  ORF Transcript_25491/g.59726 Transcript_25491/m.59726 type:complete len:82 (+) Transcript_25491:1354-1599(+)
MVGVETFATFHVENSAALIYCSHSTGSSMRFPPSSSKITYFDFICKQTTPAVRSRRSESDKSASPFTVRRYSLESPWKNSE